VAPLPLYLMVAAVGVEPTCRGYEPRE